MANFSTKEADQVMNAIDTLSREIVNAKKEHRDDIKDLKDNHFAPILAQTTKTNGRVNILELLVKVIAPFLIVAAGSVAMYLFFELQDIPEDRAVSIESLKDDLPALTEAAVNKAFLENISKFNI